MKTRLAINGFGRIGRSAFKIAFERDDIEVVAINDLTDVESLANLLRYDSNYGRYHREVEVSESGIVIDGKEVEVFSEKSPKRLPWEELQIDVVLESTGVFVTKEDASPHLEAGAQKVVISAPAKDEETNTFVLGVNEEEMSEEDAIVSNASCTTNCISPVMSVLESNFGVEKALMTTVHSYTSTQALQDSAAKDPRRGRAAAMNIIPTTTGAAKATAKVVPSLQDNFDGMAIRVPTSTGSLSDITAVLKRDTTVEEVNAAFEHAADQPYYQGILTINEDPIVSSDIIGDSHSAIVDAPFTKVVGGNLVKVLVWYDNEWGYSNRLVEMAVEVSDLISNKEQAEQDSTPAIDFSEDSPKDQKADIGDEDIELDEDIQELAQDLGIHESDEEADYQEESSSNDGVELSDEVNQLAKDLDISDETEQQEEGEERRDEESADNQYQSHSAGEEVEVRINNHQDEELDSDDFADDDEDVDEELEAKIRADLGLPEKSKKPSTSKISIKKL